MKTVIYENSMDCHRVWEELWPVKGLFDLWQVRACFHEAYQRPLRFHVIEQNKKPVGLLALCWDEETGTWVQFPGETWDHKTWLEQNRLIAKSPEVLTRLLESVHERLHLRYLEWDPLLGFMNLAQIDEVGYLFYPGLLDFSIENYWLSFPGKSRKKRKTELNKLQSKQVTFRFNQKKDLDHLFQLNLESFGDYSYFKDPKFFRSFENLTFLLDKLGILRIITVLIDNQIAAVDMGAMWKNSCTVLAGGTDPRFPGVAKLINLHHLDWACSQRLDSVDFLCGDFNWKERFHLTPRPLYQIKIDNAATMNHRGFDEKQVACL